MAQLGNEGQGMRSSLKARLSRLSSGKQALLAVGALLACASLAAGMLCARPFDEPVAISSGEAQGPTEDHEVAAEATEEQAAVLLVVDVSGAVASPGVYELEEGSRVQDALLAAGGTTDDAALSSLNRASLVVDGQKIQVPSINDKVNDSESGAAAPSSPAQGDGAPISINSASAEELDGLPGVGPATAQAIVEFREKEGGFSSLEDLMLVDGIGEKKFEKLKDGICL